MSMQSLVDKAWDTFGLQVNHSQAQMFSMYRNLLLEWNNKVNLTAITDPLSIENKHFLDSLSCVPLVRGFLVEEMIDIGTGAGFPGIPIKIMLPDLQLTLLEAVGKKADFCAAAVKTLGLEGVTVIHGRAEEVGQNPAHRERYDLGTARAVAQLPVLSEYLLPLIKVGGKMIAQKGKTGQDEVIRAEHAINLLGGKFQKLLPVSLPGIDEPRYLVVIQKVSATNAKYPRRAGIPAKKPL